jgi:hypothetical protein
MRWLLLFALAACQCEKPAELDRLPSAGGAPVEIDRLTASLTTAARVGSGITLDSSSPKNSVHLEFRVTARDGWVRGASISTRYACRVGELVWADTFSSDAGLHDLGAGQSRESSAASFMPNPFAAGPPSACEWTLKYDYTLLDTGVEVTPAAIGRVCWRDGELTAGACPEGAIDRAPASAPIAVAHAETGWSDAPGGSGRVLAFRGAFTAGAETDSQIFAVAACDRGDRPPKTETFSMMARTASLEPGETLFADGVAFLQHPLERDARRCTVVIRTRPNAEPARGTAIASSCLEGGAVREGACDGLAPGAVEMRIAAAGGGFEATLVRGSHREGPFTLGPTAAPAELAPIVASIEEANDEAVVIVAPADFPAAAMFAITEAFAAADLPLALAR